LSRSPSHNCADFYGHHALPHDPRFGIDPAVLLSSGILRNPAVPEQASLRAKSLIEAGRFREARAILQPHAHSAPEPWRARITDQLAQCAMYGGGDWLSPLTSALDMHAQSNGLAELAGTHQRLGEMLLLQGEFALADKHFISADHIYSTLVDPGKTARVGALRARLHLRAGRAEAALVQIDETLQRLGDREPRARAFAKLERARVQACRGRDDDAARELIQAEGVLGVSSNAADRLATRLVRAEALIVLGDIPRAIKGLRRLLAEAIGIEDVYTRALAHALFGQATLDEDASQSRRHLARAHHLYESIGATYQLAWCELMLARVDFRLGLNPRSRLKALAQRPLGAWPLLRVELAIARGEIYGMSQADRARDSLMRARMFSARNGHLSLVRLIDVVLVAQRLMSDREIDELTPIESSPLIESGSSYAPDQVTQLTFASVANPAPYVIDEPAHRRHEDTFATRHNGLPPKRHLDKPLPHIKTSIGPRPLDNMETLAHVNAGDALRALELLVPAANDDAKTMRVELALRGGTLVTLRASKSRSEQ